jgi:hypothetical protein
MGYYGAQVQQQFDFLGQFQNFNMNPQRGNPRERQEKN